MLLQILKRIYSTKLTTKKSAFKNEKSYVRSITPTAPSPFGFQWRNSDCRGSNGGGEKERRPEVVTERGGGAVVLPVVAAVR
jgi:hypothetical protein